MSLVLNQQLPVANQTTGKWITLYNDSFDIYEIAANIQQVSIQDQSMIKANNTSMCVTVHNKARVGSTKREISL